MYASLLDIADRLESAYAEGKCRSENYYRNKLFIELETLWWSS
jgi:hypothetical protein